MCLNRNLRNLKFRVGILMDCTGDISGVGAWLRREEIKLNFDCDKS
jgi:hypothetical protein